MNDGEVKRTLRQRIIALCDGLSEGQRRSHSGRICAAILELGAYREARMVAAYMSIGSEPETRALAQHALTSGKGLALPRINRGKDGLELYEVRDLAADLKPGVWGIPEPDPGRCRPVADLGELGFILVPGVAFGPEGERLARATTIGFCGRLEGAVGGFRARFRYRSFPAFPWSPRMSGLTWW